MISTALIASIERASLEIDMLVEDIHQRRLKARSLEDVEERVKGIASHMIAAVRGPDAATDSHRLSAGGN